jgi:hypothetical protein
MNWLRKLATPLVIGVVGVVFVISLWAVIHWWGDPAKVQAIGGFFAVVSTLILVIITWAYVRANQQSIEENRRQQERVQPILNISLLNSVVWFTQKDVDLTVWVTMRVSNPSPFTKSSLWLATAQIVESDLKLRAWTFTGPAVRTHADPFTFRDEKTSNLGPGESKEETLFLAFPCTEWQPETATVVLTFRDAFGKDTVASIEGKLHRKDWRDK